MFQWLPGCKDCDILWICSLASCFTVHCHASLHHLNCSYTKIILLVTENDVLSCADPETFVRGVPNLIKFFFKLMRGDFCLI